MDEDEDLAEEVDRLQSAVIRRAWDHIEMHASLHDDWGPMMADLRDPDSDVYRAFMVGLWSAYSATTMVFIDEGIVRRD